MISRGAEKSTSTTRAPSVRHRRPPPMTPNSKEARSRGTGTREDDEGPRWRPLVGRFTDL